MFKKICLLLLCFTVFGCQKSKTDDLSKNIQKNLKKADTYILKGNLELYSDEETYKYTIEVDYNKPNYYYVSMINKANDKEQIILKNDDGLYVITPSLNKSFKFDSNWPSNSSQVYIVESLLNDIKTDENIQENSTENYLRCKVDYPNNPDLSYEKIYLDADDKISKVEVYNSSDILKIKIEFNSFDINPKINQDVFKLNSYLTTSKCDDDSCTDQTTMNNIDEAIYPLYMPVNTYLNNSEIVSGELFNRAILTFSGDNNFVIIEQPTVANSEMEIIPVYGNPVFINDSIAAVSSNSIYFTSGDVDYYLASQDMNQEQMISVASSLGTTKSVLATTK